MHSLTIYPPKKCGHGTENISPPHFPLLMRNNHRAKPDLIKLLSPHPRSLCHPTSHPPRGETEREMQSQTEGLI